MNLLRGWKIEETLLGLPNQTVCKDPAMEKRAALKGIDEQLDGIRKAPTAEE